MNYTTIRSFGIIAPLVLGLSGCTSVEDQLNQQGFVSLSGSQIVDVISGNTFVGEVVATGRSHRVFTADSRRLSGEVALEDGSVVTDQGSWKIEGDTFCDIWDNWDHDCDTILLKGSQYVLLNPDGSVSARGNIQSGNLYGL